MYLVILVSKLLNFSFKVIQPVTVSHMYQLGPHYMGSFQAPNLPGLEPTQLVAEEKVVFGLNAKAVNQLTLSKIRKVYSRTDNKSIAKQLGMSSHENATPIRILHNSAGHLAGPSRTLGGVVIGYLGVRVFCPRPVATMVNSSHSIHNSYVHDALFCRSIPLVVVLYFWAS